MSDSAMPAAAPPDLSALLVRFPALAGLDAATRDSVLRSLQWLQVPRAAPLFAAGDRCRAFPLLLAGEVRVVRDTPDGHEIELYRIRPGESCIVSSSCLLGTAAYPARADVVADARLAVMPDALFERLLADHPPFRRYVFGEFSGRLAQMMQRVEDLAFRSLTRRIAVLMLAQPDGMLAATHEKLAAQIGASREAVSRVLKKLEDAGSLSLARGRIAVADRARLRAEV